MDEGYHPEKHTRDDSLCIIWRVGWCIPEGVTEGQRVRERHFKTAASSLLVWDCWWISSKCYLYYILYCIQGLVLNIGFLTKTEVSALAEKETFQSKRVKIWGYVPPSGNMVCCIFKRLAFQSPGLFSTHESFQIFLKTSNTWDLCPDIKVFWTSPPRGLPIWTAYLFRLFVL